MIEMTPIRIKSKGSREDYQVLTDMLNEVRKLEKHLWFLYTHWRFEFTQKGGDQNCSKIPLKND